MLKLILIGVLFSVKGFAGCGVYLDRIAEGEVHSMDLEFEDLFLDKELKKMPKTAGKILKNNKIAKYFVEDEIQGRKIMDLSNYQRDSYFIIKEDEKKYYSFIVYVNKECEL